MGDSDNCPDVDTDPPGGTDYGPDTSASSDTGGSQTADD
jgi:hypothetical protein